MAGGRALSDWGHLEREEEEKRKTTQQLDTAARGKLIMRSDCPLSPERARKSKAIHTRAPRRFLFFSSLQIKRPQTHMFPFNRIFSIVVLSHFFSLSPSRFTAGTDYFLIPTRMTISHLKRDRSSSSIFYFVNSRSKNCAVRANKNVMIFQQDERHFAFHFICCRKILFLFFKFIFCLSNNLVRTLVCE